MSGTLVLILALVALGVGVGVGVYARLTRVEDPPPPPPRRWKDNRITPVMAGPRNTVKERVSRGSVMAMAVLLAVEMASADGEILEEELDHVRDFIRNYVVEADDEFTEMVVQRGLITDRNDRAVEKACATIRAVASTEQRRMVLHLLVFVAKADGIIDPGEVAFLIRVAPLLGFEEEEVKGLLHSKEPPSYIQDSEIWRESGGPG